MSLPMQGAKLDDSQIIALAAELNHLLWTDDPPEVTPDIAKVMRDDPMMELSRLNMHGASLRNVLQEEAWRQLARG